MDRVHGSRKLEIHVKNGCEEEYCAGQCRSDEIDPPGKPGMDWRVMVLASERIASGFGQDWTYGDAIDISKTLHKRRRHYCSTETKRYHKLGVIILTDSPSPPA